MTDHDEIERTLDRLPAVAPPADAAARVRRAMGPLTPVKPLLPPVMRAAGAALAGLAVTVSIAFASRSGFRPMGASDWAVFALLGAVGVLGAWLSMRMAVPGRMPSLPWRLTLFAAVPAGLAGVVMIAVGSSGPMGPPSCLLHGLGAAIAPWLVTAWLVRRGYPTAPAIAGGATGMAGGLWGVAMLHLTCPMLTGPHLMLFHGGVLVVAASIGAVLGALILRVGPARSGG